MIPTVWHTCPRCRLDLGTPVVGDDHLRTCLFCGKVWRDPQPTELDDSRRLPVDWLGWAR